MPQATTPHEPWRKTQSIVDRLYRLLLYAYPKQFRRTYGALMAQAFRDSCRDRLRGKGLPGLLSLCLFLFLTLSIMLFVSG